MITSKYITAITAVLLCITLVVCGFIAYAADNLEAARITEYQKRLFGDEVITLDIQVDSDEWQTMLDHATDKEWIVGDLIINGARFSAIGIRTKGNSSLSQTTTSNSDRYSLQFKANHYIKGQTFYGLDTFCINNLMGDATYMKDYLSYDIMKFIGVATPLTNYASVTVNGEDYGFFLALERYDQSFLDRTYGTSDGQLYNVKIQMGQRGDFEDMWQNIINEMPNRQQGNARLPGGQQGGIGTSRQSGGGSLIYTDDDPGSYSAIFDNAIFKNNSTGDQQRVIEALKNLKDGTDLEKYFDVDAILRYFAAHTVVVNLDSYISNMQQNYYLYEHDGKITILPWDYGLAFGGFQSSSASSVVNFPIDTPINGVSMEDRPLLSKLLEIDEFLERYHFYLQQIVEGYFESGLFESTVTSLDAKINQYVKGDVSAYYTYEQYESALPVLIELGRLRAESIRGQLNGTIPSTSSGQSADPSLLTDASGLNLAALGSMMGMGGGMGQNGQQNNQNQPGGWTDRQDDLPTIPDRRPGGQTNTPWDGGINPPDSSVQQE